MNISRREFEAQRQRRFGAANPERMRVPFWEQTVLDHEEAHLRRDAGDDDRDGLVETPYGARRHFGLDGDFSGGPIWTFDRMGMTRTHHPDGRVICVGGEHEDFYDPDFCIYNDVVVLDLDGSVAIFGYPPEVFPPTDFHTATMLGDRILLIGRIGYQEARHPGLTPVLALDLESHRIRERPSHGEAPGWIFRHEATIGPDGVITVSGGEVFEERDGQHHIRRNFDDFAYDPKSGLWRKLTRRGWRQYTIRDADRKPFLRGPRFMGCGADDHEPWKGEPEQIPDDFFLWVEPEALYPRTVDHEPIWTDEFRPDVRFEVAGIPVAVNYGGLGIEIIIEGDMDAGLARKLAEDILSGIEDATERPCVLDEES